MEAVAQGKAGRLRVAAQPLSSRHGSAVAAKAGNTIRRTRDVCLLNAISLIADVWAFRRTETPGSRGRSSGRASAPAGSPQKFDLYYAASGSSIRNVVPRPTSEVKSIEPL